MSDLVLIRHGETVGESSVRLYGRTDIELSDHGREQMRLAGAALAGAGFERAYASPLKRSREAAALVLAGSGLEPEIIDGFREIDFGDWEGWSLEEARERDPENHARWKADGIDFGFPGGDTKTGFFTRAAEAGRAVFAAPCGLAVAVLHKGVIKALLAELLGIDFEETASMPVELGSIHRLDRTGSGWQLASANETKHLGDYRIPSSR